MGSSENTNISLHFRMVNFLGLSKFIYSLIVSVEVEEVKFNSVSTAGVPEDISMRRPLLNFIRHGLEMFLAMFIGMFALAAIFTAIVSIWGMTWLQGRERFPELFLLAIALGMTVPMVAWMRYRHHTWRTSSEMAAAMFIPGIVFIGLVSLRVISVGPACSLYCALMIPLMLIPMLSRREEYSQDHRHHMSSIHQHHHHPSMSR
jgi:hypothetical protein